MKQFPELNRNPQKYKDFSCTPILEQKKKKMCDWNLLRLDTDASENGAHHKGGSQCPGSHRQGKGSVNS